MGRPRSVLICPFVFVFHDLFSSFFKMGQSRPLFVYFCYFLDTISIIQIEKNINGVVGIQTRGRRMVGADKTTELWRTPNILFFYLDMSYCDFLFYWANPGLFFFIFVFLIQLTVNVQNNFCRWLDLNCRPLEWEPTALPTESQPLSFFSLFTSCYVRTNSWP